MNDAGWLDQVAAWLLVDENLDRLVVDLNRVSTTERSRRSSSVERVEARD